MATQNVYRSIGAITTFRGAGGGDILWTPQNEGTGKGRISAVWDRGAGNRPVRYRWRCSSRWAATPAANDALRLYVIGSSASADAALTDGNFAFGDAELTSEANLLANCTFLGAVIAATATDQLWVASGIVLLYDRYIGVACWNGSATKALTNTVTDHVLTFTAMPDSIEAPA